MVKRAAYRFVPLALAIAAAPLATLGCQSILGLGSETNLPEAGAPEAGPSDGGAAKDAHRDTRQPSNAARVVAASNGGSDWCVVTENGDVECWGNNESGELGNGTLEDSWTPVKVLGLPPASYVSIGDATVCALTREGAVYCWGLGEDDALGTGTSLPLSKTAVPVSGLEEGVTAVSCGYGASCAIKNGGVVCWGYGGNGLLGRAQSTDSPVPAGATGLESGVTAISVGGNSACAVKGGAVLCWGAFDGYGELGNGSTNASSIAVPVTGLSSGVVAVSVGLDFACALTEAGGLLCWGDGTRGALGNGQLALTPSPVQVVGLTSGVSAVSAGSMSTSAILDDGSVVAWGYAGDGELGNDSAEFDSPIGSGGGGASRTPVHVKDLSGPAVSIATGQAPCVATQSGHVECWGVVAESALTPVTVVPLVGVTAITAGGNLTTGSFACATTSDGPILCWGGNTQGQLGSGTNTDSTTPVESAAVFSGSSAVSAGVNGNFACGVASGLAYCWGDNSSGQLGNGTTKSSRTPVGVEGLGIGVVSVSAGATSACAVTTATGDGGSGGAVYCWGGNTFGQLGDGSTTNRTSPVLVTGLGSGVTAVSVGVASACALLQGGTVECWGNNSFSQLGNGTGNPSLVPAPVVGITDGATAIATGWVSTCAVVSGAVLCWGDNEYDELGNASVGESSTVPVPVTGIFSDATQVSVGESTACAVVAGRAMCWGYGPLGSDTPPGVFVPKATQVTGLETGVTQVSVAVTFACAVVSGMGECWGLNTAGQLGNGGAVDAFLPTPIAGFP
jgi:alpha-tubulin suppressor-like RCC1 family protein